MNYQDIKTFLTIVSSSSLSKAAEVLFVSQPALSHRLSALEEELGTELIIRKKGSRTLELTDAGQRFVPLARKWEQLWLDTSKIQYEKPQDILRIANVDSLNFYFMPQVIGSFLEKHKRCSFHIDTMRSNVSYKAVENKEVDMGLITNPHFFKKVQTVPLFEEKLVLVCSKDTAYEDGILPSRLKSEDEIYIPWSDSFIMWHDYWFGNNSEVKVSLDNMALLRQLLDLEKTWAIMPATIGKKLSQEGECRIVALENGPEYRTCYAIMGDRRNATPLVMDFLQELLDTVKGIPGDQSAHGIYPSGTLNLRDSRVLMRLLQAVSILLHHNCNHKNHLRRNRCRNHHNTSHHRNRILHHSWNRRKNPLRNLHCLLPKNPNCQKMTSRRR